MTIEMRTRVLASSAVIIAASGLVLAWLPLVALPFGEVSVVDIAAGALTKGHWSLYRVVTVLSCFGLLFATAAGIWVIVRLRASAALLALIICVAFLGSGWIIFIVLKT